MWFEPETLKAGAVIVIISFGILIIAFMAKMLYLQIFYTVDDDDIKPKDYLIDDFYETNIGDKR